MLAYNYGSRTMLLVIVRYVIWCHSVIQCSEKVTGSISRCVDFDAISWHGLQAFSVGRSLAPTSATFCGVVFRNPYLCLCNTLFFWVKSVREISCIFLSLSLLDIPSYSLMLSINCWGFQVHGNNIRTMFLYFPCTETHP
jgi:hypothetical protein